MRHKKTSKRRGGGTWLDPTSWDVFQKKPEQVVQDAPAVTEQVVKDVVEPLGGTPESTNTPGGMSASAPAATLGGRRRKTRRRKTRHRSKRGGVGETTTCKAECPKAEDKKHAWGAWKNLGDVRQRQCSKCKCIEEV